VAPPDESELIGARLRGELGHDSQQQRARHARDVVISRAHLVGVGVRVRVRVRARARVRFRVRVGLGFWVRVRVRVRLGSASAGPTIGEPLLPSARLATGRSAARTSAIRPRARRAACAVVGPVALRRNAHPSSVGEDRHSSAEGEEPQRTVPHSKRTGSTPQ